MPANIAATNSPVSTGAGFQMPPIVADLRVWRRS